MPQKKPRSTKGKKNISDSRDAQDTLEHEIHESESHLNEIQEITESESDGGTPTETWDNEPAAPSDREMDEDDANLPSTAISASPNSRLRNMMNQNFIEYASYVIKDRAIPDVDDGLKPVQRRILWTLFERDNGLFHKVANIMGDTMRFHPHGDRSIGDALVNLANKDVYIEKQGSFGSIILGTPAAAPRYIECRLAPLAREVLFNRDITELVDSYDGRYKEPVCLPSKIPTLLLMGTDGIAVGTKTRILPHNFNELLNAQISILKGEPFKLYPDFMQGGEMDVSGYDDGLGKVVVRSKIEIEGRNLAVKEIPAATDTGKLMDSIEAAVNKNKIKIASFHDYTAENVNIQLVPMRGYDPEKALNALYAYTDCQMNISSMPMVIVDNRPVRMSVTEILKRNTDRLLCYLKWELQIEAGKCLDKILARTLAQIFIEEKVYKSIEKCKSKEAMFEAVRAGLAKFQDEWLPIVQQLHENIVNGPHIMPMPKEAQERLEQLSRGMIPDGEVDSLVSIPIRRIAAFEIDENKEQIKGLKQTLNEAARNLKRLNAYAIKYIQGLIDRYGAMFPRRTIVRLDGFEKIDKCAVALNNIRVGWDKKNCYIGTNVKSDDTLVCNEYDHLLCVERTGEYKVINIPDIIYIDRLFEFRKYDKNTMFGLVYSEKKTGKVYYKRVVIDKFITDKEYRIIPEGCRLDMITPRPNALYEIKIDTPIKAKQIQTINLMDAPLRSSKAGGSPISPRKLLKITFVQYLDGTEDLEQEQNLIDLPTPGQPQTPEEDVKAVSKQETEGKSSVSKTKLSTEKQTKKATPSVSATSHHVQNKPPAQSDSESQENPREEPAEKPQNEDEENWGIQQPDLGF